ncbi:hypothetical protein HY837_06225 [archaeon]|nr:hypothetical protein [archaeon]
MKIVIEHMEPKLWEWCLIEYEHISKIIGKNNVWFTNCSNKEVLKFGLVKKESVAKLNLPKSCLLDPKAEKELSPEDAEKFDYFIFGGILGNAPAEGRTQILSKELSCEKRSLGSKQMSTDTAVLVTKLVLDGKKLEEISFIDSPELKSGKNESIIMPYRYVSEKGKPVIYKKLMPLIKEEF